MDHLYDTYRTVHGWLTHLMNDYGLSQQEIAYLSWRDDCQKPVDKAMAAWMDEIEGWGGADIYNEADETCQFVMLTKKINELQDTLDPDLLGRLVANRYRLKYALMRRIEPEAFEDITETEINRARAYPLWKLMGLPRSKNIKCPLHEDRSPSFKVGVWGYCFSCHYWVDSIGYLMEKSINTFSQAVKALANR